VLLACAYQLTGEMKKFGRKSAGSCLDGIAGRRSCLPSQPGAPVALDGSGCGGRFLPCAATAGSAARSFPNRDPSISSRHYLPTAPLWLNTFNFHHGINSSLKSTSFLSSQSCHIVDARTPGRQPRRTPAFACQNTEKPARSNGLLHVRVPPTGSHRSLVREHGRPRLILVGRELSRDTTDAPASPRLFASLVRQASP
jgi:hypothetical protein